MKITIGQPTPADAKKITIRVTQEDIDKGVACRGESCAVANAVRRQLNRYDVTVSASYVWMKGGAYRFRVSDKMREFIKRFDEGKKVKPDTFELVIMGEDK